MEGRLEERSPEPTRGAALARWLDGGATGGPTWAVARRAFLRLLGVVFAIAFASLGVQVDGLVGERGISPVGDYLAAARGALGPGAPWALPSLCWIDASNAFLHGLCAAGTGIAVLLVAGIAPAACLAALLVLYLSLVVAGQAFLGFQWDVLLLETAFLAIFLAPWRWRLRRGGDPPVPRVALFLMHALLFKLMFMSGAVKLTSGDDAWWRLTALDYHYWTQPLPNPIAWWMAQAPGWFQRLSTLFALVVETVVPLGIWGPRRIRLTSCALLVALQLLIGLTGNYNFFNVLTVALCLLLLDDESLRRIRARLRRSGGGAVPAPETRGSARPPNLAALVVLAVTLPVNALYVARAWVPELPWPQPIGRVARVLAPFHVLNGYGLFRVMTKTRPEIVIEGSDDGTDWRPYVFRYKPGPPGRPPPWVEPYQPRLDWQMWFAALGSYARTRWFHGLAARLLQGEPDVLALLETDPFPDHPPRYLRARLYDYRFTTLSERRATGDWWRRERVGDYMPAASLAAPDRP